MRPYVSTNSLSQLFQLLKLNPDGVLSHKRSEHSDLSESEDHFLHRERLFRLEMTNYRDKTLELSEDFVAAVEEDLPDRYVSGDASNRKDYEDFFDDYGHFVVTANDGGGSLAVHARTLTAGDGEESGAEAELKLEAAFNKVISKFIGAGKDSAEADASSETSDAREEQIMNAAVCIKGGERRFWADTLKEMNGEQWNKWKESLQTNPAMLNTNMTLVPIYKVNILTITGG